MKALLAALSLALVGVTLALAPLDADAQRLGRGRPIGMQRQLPPAKPAQQQPPAQQATPQNATAPAAAAAPVPRRSWLGPIAGLAAGLGIAALLSHFGLGEGAANVITMLLIVLAVVFVLRWLLRRRAQPALAYAGAAPPMQCTAHEFTASPPVESPAALPAGFDVQAFERVAKLLFVRLQAANDAGQLDDLRKFTSPELFAALQLDLHERSGKPQRTDVVQLDAQVIDTAREGDQWVASVRFHGLIREQADGAAEPFDEVWHFVRPDDGSREWAIAGIAPQ